MITQVMELKTVALLPDGCFSVLLWRGTPFAVTAERTFEDGKPVLGNGSFNCVRSYFHRGGYPTFEIIVAGHSRVLFHRGNTEQDSLGCVCIAEKFGILNKQIAVLESNEGFEEFLRLTNGLDTFQLTISGR